MGGRQAHRRDGARHVRPARRGGEQCRHPAGRHLPQDGPGRLGGGGRRPPQRQLLHEPGRRRSVPRAGQRRLCPHDQHVGADRQFRAGELRGGQARPRRPLEVDRPRHGPVRRPLELRGALRLEPDDRFDPRHHPRGAAAGRPHEAHDAADQRPARRLPGLAGRRGRDRAGLRHPGQRGLPVQPDAAGPQRARRRGLDPGLRRRPRDARPAGELRAPRPLRRRLQLGPV